MVECEYRYQEKMVGTLLFEPIWRVSMCKRLKILTSKLEMRKNSIDIQPSIMKVVLNNCVNIRQKSIQHHGPYRVITLSYRNYCNISSKNQAI